MSEPRLACAVLGASGYIGQHFVRLLHDHPGFELIAVVAGPHSRGRTLGDVWQLTEDAPKEWREAKLEEATPLRLQREGVRLVFSALPSGHAGAIERAISRRGIAVFSNASDHRLDRDVPLLVPEVNADHLQLLASRRRGSAPLVTNPNCSAAGLVLSLTPVWKMLAPKVVHVTTFQALSGAGFPGVSSLTVTDNVVPFIDSEEEKIARESARMLGRFAHGSVLSTKVDFLANCARVGVRDGHLEAVTVEATRSPSMQDLARAWRKFDPLTDANLSTSPHPPVLLRPEPDRPQPLRDRWAGEPERARGMAVTVGRLRWDPPYLRYFALSHNAVRGGAGGSVLNAELALARGYLTARS